MIFGSTVLAVRDATPRAHGGSPPFGGSFRRFVPPVLVETAVRDRAWETGLGVASCPLRERRQT